jgi:predicted AlkP superfamily pyrophosphatase or phosphodiesterase
MDTSSLGSRLFFVSLVVLFLLLGVGGNRWLLAAETTPSDEVAAPRLVVVLVIDQFRGDYLARFRDRFGPDGLNRLLREGANFVSCFYPYANTLTAPGHATLATGTTPDRHGIAGNSWYDTQRGRVARAVEDESFPVVGTTSNLPGVSPHSLVGTTLTDQLGLATGGEAKIFGVAIKGNSVVFSTGHSASGAYWYDSQTGRFITSRYYREELPKWVRAFNERRGPDRYYGKNWKGEERIFVEMTTASGKPDPAFYSRVRITPYGNEIVLDFARELVKQEGLGEDGVTDFLFIGFSSNDAVGHQWGPYSDEVADMTLRTDEQVARLLKFLDRRVGEGQYWLALSADHGVSPTLAQARARGLEATNIDSGALGEAMRIALRERWGEDEGEWLIPEAGLVFNRDWLKKRGVSLEEAVQVVGEAAMTVEGIAGYVGARVSSVDAATTAAVRRSFYPGRGNDMALIHDRYALFNAERGGATHGTHYPYDTHVPLIFFGGAFRPGTYPERVSTTDLATTLAAALGLTPPALATGKVLARALGSAKASSAARE